MTELRITAVLTIERAGSRVEISVRNGHWWVERFYNEPTEFHRQTILGEPISQTRESEPAVACDNHQLLNLLTQDECSQLLGYCSHLLEQGVTHLTYLYTAMGEAMERKDWAVVREQLEELHDEIGTHDLIRSLATRILTTEDVEA